MDNFGKMRQTYFDMNCNTSWIMETLEKKSNDEYSYDTLKLVRVFQLGVVSDDHEKSDCFLVSFYVKREPNSNQNVIDSKLTLSKFKKTYAEKYFSPADAENDPFLSMLLSEISKLDLDQQKQDIIFNHGILFKARALVNLNEKGKTKTYCFIGVSLEKI